MWEQYHIQASGPQAHFHPVPSRRGLARASLRRLLPREEAERRVVGEALGAGAVEEVVAHRNFGIVVTTHGDALHA